MNKEETEIQDPAFKTMKDAMSKVYTKKYQSHPIIDSDGKLIACFQVESKYRILQKQNDNKKVSIGNQNQKKHIGFSFMDE